MIQKVVMMMMNMVILCDIFVDVKKDNTKKGSTKKDKNNILNKM